jgi:thioredoxin 1
MRKITILLVLFLFYLLQIPVAFSSYSADYLISEAKMQGMPIMIEVGSTGCKSCRDMQIVTKQVEDEYKDKIRVIFVDINKERKTASDLKVFLIPTQIFLDKDGKETFRHSGFLSLDEIKPILKKMGL